MSNRDKCKAKGCNKKWLTYGYCLKHYLKLLQDAEKQGRKSKLHCH